MFIHRISPKILCVRVPGREASKSPPAKRGRIGDSHNCPRKARRERGLAQDPTAKQGGIGDSHRLPAKPGAMHVRADAALHYGWCGSNLP